MSARDRSTAHQMVLPLTADKQVVVVPGRWYPLLGIDLRWTLQGWWSAGFASCDPGVWECWRGPYGSEEAAIRNGACFLRDGMRARRLRGFAKRLTAFFNLPGGAR